HVETRAVLEQFVSLQIRKRQTGEPLLLLRSDGFGRMARLVRAARLDLDEHDGATVHGHQIQLAQATAGAAGDDLVAQPPQVTLGRALAASAQRAIAPPGYTQ